VNGADLVQRVRSQRARLRHHPLGSEADQGLAAAWLRKLKDEQQAIGASWR